jgi:hypothetical protein
MEDKWKKSFIFRRYTIIYDYGTEEQVLETGGEAEREEHRDSSVDIEKPTATGYFFGMI